MNDLLRITEDFASVPSVPPGPPSLPPSKIEVSDIDRVLQKLESVIEYWNKDKLIKNSLVAVEYKEVIAKSNRVKMLFKSADSKIRGAKYLESPKRHVITYLLKREDLKKALAELKLFKEQFISLGGYDAIQLLYSELLKATPTRRAQIQKSFEKPKLSAYACVKWIRDIFYIRDLYVPNFKVNQRDAFQIVSLFDVGEDFTALLEKIGIQHLHQGGKIAHNIFELESKDLVTLLDNAPYLVSMGEPGRLNAIKAPDFIESESKALHSIPRPLGSEPVVGVIDTLFDERVSFSEWVEYEDMLKEDLFSHSGSSAYGHGTAVTSLVVCGHVLNPELDDGCGFFRVKHFGVSNGSNLHYLTLIDQIRKIIKDNPMIKVWNLALGSSYPIQEDSVSLLASELDNLQNENDVIFVIAGTNLDKSINGTANHLIGMPADSINSLVVNSVDENGRPASYSRKGPVLDYFTKPDLACRGGEKSKEIKVVSGWNENFGDDIRAVYGTSFATPWISRKLAYLIHTMKLRKEEAKALLLDSTQFWDSPIKRDFQRGHGIVPQRIESIINVPDDEIRFILTSVAESYETKTLTIPVPFSSKGYPFVARATLSYCPECDKNQGVDYTNTEMDIHFGRCYISDKGKVLIKAIDNNLQAEEGIINLKEKHVREHFGKWDNVKIIKEKLTSRTREKKRYSDSWGISLKRKERLNSADKKPILFSVVITLKEIRGKNRFQQFVDLVGQQHKVITRFNIEAHNKLRVQEEEDLAWS